MSATAAERLADWPARFPGCGPVAHEMRTAFRERWVRFHSLPESKRYPDDEGEYRTLLDRHDAVMADLAGPGCPVVLLTTAYAATPDPTPRLPELAALDPGAAWRLALEPHGPGEGFWHLYASAWDWRPGALDGVVRLVADDRASNVLIVGPGCRWVLHPYDGGMDVILESPAARGRLRAAHSGWLSARPDGL